MTSLGGTYLAVDEIQPFAVALNEQGDILGEISWNHVDPPKKWSWPQREITSDDSSAWVRDLPDGPTVRIWHSRIEGWRAAAADQEFDISNVTRRARSRFTMGRTVKATDGRRWTYMSRLDGFQWESFVHTDQLGENEESWPLGLGSITCSAESDRTAAVCIRRAAKRPWEFHADHEMFILAPGKSPAQTSMRRDSLDISRNCWDNTPQLDIANALSQYLPYTISESRAAIREGASDVSITIENLEIRPVVKIAFTFGDRRYHRLDEPVDELGRLYGGLRDLGIFLEEDFRKPELLQSSTAREAVIRI